MSEVQIPERSLARLRAAYQQFESIAGLIAEAMGLDPTAVANVNVEAGTFTVREGAVPSPAAHSNGVAA